MIVVLVLILLALLFPGFMRAAVMLFVLLLLIGALQVAGDKSHAPPAAYEQNYER